MSWRVLQGDCRLVLATLESDSIDSCVTDPPYELAFMGKKWDASGIAFNADMWREVYRVLKPGAHLLAFGGTRTYHRMTCAIEDAGFEIRDCLAWIYATGFPKSLDVSKAIDAAAGAERKVVGTRDRYLDGHARNNLGATGGEFLGLPNGIAAITAPATEAARRWQGFGTAAKPAHEPVIVARKPMPEETEVTECLSALCARLAAESLESSRSEFFAAFDSALRLAAPAFATPGDSREAMDTSPSAWGPSSSLNIASSWLRIWAERCAPTSTSTTGTESRATTESRILKSLVSRIMRGSTLPDRGREFSFLVGTVADLFRGFRASLEATRALHAIESATAPWPGPFRVKPALTPIVLARKPLTGTVAANVLSWGTGAINVDACRIGTTKNVPASPKRVGASEHTVSLPGNRGTSGWDVGVGRWPANLLLDPGAAEMLDRQSGERRSSGVFEPQGDGIQRRDEWATNFGGRDQQPASMYADSGGASRFFYVAKPDRTERDAGLWDLDPVSGGKATERVDGSAGLNSPRAGAGRNGGATSRRYAPTSWVNEALVQRLPADMGASMKKATAESTIPDNSGSAWSMCWCGSPSTDPYHPAIRSIIATATRSITESKTWPSSTRPHTNGCMAAACAAVANGGSPAECAESPSPWAQRIGTSVPKDGRSTEDANLATSVASWLRSKPGQGGGHRVGVRNVHPT